MPQGPLVSLCVAFNDSWNLDKLIFVVNSRAGEIGAARQAEGSGALPALQRVPHHVLPLVIGDVPSPRRHAERRQRHGRHRPLHQLDVICSRQEVSALF